jgi:hypothetical protein
VVVDAVSIEPVSASKFPDMREFAGNFSQFAGNSASARPKHSCCFKRLQRIPYAMEQGIFPL